MPGEQIIESVEICLETADTARLVISFYVRPVYVDCLYITGVILQTTSQQTVVWLQSGEREATKDQLFGAQNLTLGHHGIIGCIVSSTVLAEQPVFLLLTAILKKRDN
jgi:hypothetical protein